MKFTDLDFDPQLLEALSYTAFETATPIQEKAIPIISDNKDIIACAQTGTGKTGAFLLPILNKIVNREEEGVNTLIIAPTRELVIQIEQQIQGLAYFINVSSQTIYGGGDGKDWEARKNSLKNGTDIVVATPGKLLAILTLGIGNFKKFQHLVLDEADRMLDMGFLEDIKKIITYLPESRQTIMFSATMSDPIRQLAQKIAKTKPEEVSLAIAKPAAGVDHKAHLCYDEQKNKLLDHILKARPDFESIILFTSTKSKVGDIVRALKTFGYSTDGISSNLEQRQREIVLGNFASRQTRILVATDVMSRGIDIKEINMVINYDVPNDAADYVHRVGRTARANTKGEAFTLVNPKDMPRLKRIEDLIESKIPKETMPEEIGKAPEWRTTKGGKPNQPSKNKNFKGKKKWHPKKKKDGNNNKPDNNKGNA